MEKRIKLNIGGKHFETTQDTLTTNSGYFRAMIERWNSNKDENGEIFINRSGSIFKHVLRLMLDPEYNYPNKYISELDFYQITIYNNNNEQKIFTEYKRLLLSQYPNFDFSIFKELIEWFYEQVMIKYGDIQNNKFPNDKTIKSFNYIYYDRKIEASNFTYIDYNIKILEIQWATCTTKYINYEDDFIPKKFVDISHMLESIAPTFTKILLGLLKEKLTPHTDMYKIDRFDFHVGKYTGCANAVRPHFCTRPGDCLEQLSNIAFKLSIGFAIKHNKLVKHLHNDIFG